MCEPDTSCPFPESDCGLQQMTRNPCCKNLCFPENNNNANGMINWRDPGGLAGFLTNFTRSLWGWDDSPVMLSQQKDLAGKSGGVVSLLPPVNSTTLRLPTIRQIFTSSQQNYRPVFPPPPSRGGDWDDDGGENDLTEHTSGAGNYEAVIIGITLLVLCLLVIAVIFVMAIFRLRNLRLLSSTTTRRPADASCTIEESMAEAEHHHRHIDVAYIADPPPAYQYAKPVCSEAPPSYEMSVMHTTTSSSSEGETTATTTTMSTTTTTTAVAAGEGEQIPSTSLPPVTSESTLHV